MAKRVNKPAVAMLTLALMVILTGAGVLLVKSMPSRDVTPLVKNAEAAMARGDYKGALELYQSAFGRSHDVKWLVEAGKVAREMGEVGGAFQMWQTAIVQDSACVEAHQNYVALWLDVLEMSDWRPSGDAATRVSQYADALLRAQPDDLNGHLARGIGYLAQRNEKPDLEAKGLDDLQNALAQRPDDERVLTVLGQYYVDIKKPAQAQKLYENLIAKEKDNAAGYLLLGKFLMGQKKADEAITYLARAVDLSKGSPKALVALAQAYQIKNQPEKADELLVKAIQADPEGFDAYLQRSRLLMSTKKSQEALQIAKDWLAKAPVLPKGLKANLIRNQRMQMQMQAATCSVILASPASETDKPNEDLLKQAGDYLATVEKDAGKDFAPPLITRADICRLRGQNIQAIKLLERADVAFSGTRADADVKIRLAELYRLDGNLGAAQKALAALQQLAPEYARGYYLQAAVAVQMNNPSSAMALLDKGLGLDPGDRDMLQLKVAVQRALGRPASEVRQTEKLLGTNSGSSVADKLQQAQRKLLDERPEEAQAILREVLASDPANVPALKVLIEMLIQGGKSDEARNLFDKAKAVAADNPRIRELEFLFTAGLTPEQRDQKVLELVKAEPDPKIRNAQLYIYYFSRRQYDEAQKVVDALDVAEPGSDRVVRMQFTLAMQREDWDRAQKWARIAGEKDLDGAEGGFFRAQLAMRRNDWPKAQSELQQALVRYPTHPAGWVWLGEVYMHLKQYDQAKDVLLNKALELNPTKGEAYKNLAYMAGLQGDQASFRSNLQKAFQYLSNDPWVVEQMTYLREQEDPDRMIEARKKALESQPNDKENLVRLALLLAKKPGQTKEAGDLLTRAMSVDPKDLRVAWSAASFWQSQKDAARAEKIMVDFEQAAQGEDKAGANALLAQLYVQQGKPDKAEQAYNVAAKLSTNPQVRMELAEFYRSAGKTQDACNTLRQAIQAAEKDPQVQAQIRQRLVEMLLGSQKLDEATAEIDAYQKARPDDSLYLLMRGTLLIQKGQAEQAVVALSDYLQKEHNSPLGLFRRGALYLAMNRLQPAITDLQAAKAASPDGFNFEHRLALAQAYEASKQTDEAVSELKEVLQAYPVQAHPESQAVAKALASLYQRLGRGRDFESLAESFVVQTPKDWSWPMALGQFAEAAGNPTKAIKAYTTAVQASEGAPEAVDSLLRAQLAAKQYDQVIAYVEKQLPENARGGPATARRAEAYFHKGLNDKARDIYKQALEETANNYVGSVMVLRSISQTFKPDEAAEMLRQRLAAKPDDVGAKYLLAVLLVQMDKYAEALPLSDQLLETAKADGDKAIVLRLRGSLFYEMSKFEDAAKTYEQLLALVPNDSDAMNNVAYIFAENLNRPAEALPYATRAVELNPRSVDLLDTLGWVQYLAGKTDDALGTLVSALQVAPNNVPAHYHLGMVYKKKASLDQAKREFELAQNAIKSSPDAPMSKMFEERVRKELAELAGQGSKVAGK